METLLLFHFHKFNGSRDSSFRKEWKYKPLYAGNLAMLLYVSLLYLFCKLEKYKWNEDSFKIPIHTFRGCLK